MRWFIKSVTNARKVIKPKPPTCINTIATAFPKSEYVSENSTDVMLLIDTNEAEVKKWSKRVPF